MVDEPVVRDRVEPRRETRLRLVAQARFDHAHPDVLVQLLGLAALAHAAQHEAKERRLVARVERFEGGGCAVAIVEHELLIRSLHALISLPLGVGNESRERARPRRRFVRARRADHAARHEVAVAVVVDRDRFCGRARGALEARVARVRGFAAAVAGAELVVAIALVRLRMPFGGRAARSAGLVRRLRLGTLRVRSDVMPRWYESPALEQCDAYDPDV